MENGTAKVIAVVGPWRSGTSCVAGVLHTLGVSMGREFRQPTEMNPKGFFEAVGLCMIVSQAIDPEEMARREDVDVASLLRRNVTMRASDSNPLGLKHPMLCLLVPDLVEAVGLDNLKIVSVTRDIETVIKSAKAVNRVMSDEDRRAAIERFIETRDNDIETLGVKSLKVNYEDVVSNPVIFVDSLIAFCDLDVGPKKRQEAIDFIEPALNRQGKEAISND